MRTQRSESATWRSASAERRSSPSSLAENGVSATDVLDALGAAAQSAGLGDREITTTVRSAYRATQPAHEATSGGQTRSAGRWFGRAASPPSAAFGRAAL